MDRWEKERRRAEALRLREHCGYFSHLGWSLFAMIVAMTAAQMVLMLWAQLSSPELMNSGAFLWLLSVGVMYGVGMPVLCGFFRRLPAPPVTRGRPLGPARFVQVYLIALAGLYLSNYVTLGITWLIGQLRGSPVANPVETMTGYPAALNVLLGCVIAPVCEELAFRRLLLDRLRPYGDRFAVCVSALCFGLFHGNLSQMLYAFTVGLVLGYVALRTGRIWQAMLLHAMVNAVSVVLIPLTEQVDALTGTAVSNLFWGCFLIAVILLGIVFFAALRRELWFDPGRTGFTEGRKWGLFFGSPGVVFFCVAEGLMAASYLMAA